MLVNPFSVQYSTALYSVETITGKIGRSSQVPCSRLSHRTAEDSFFCFICLSACLSAHVLWYFLRPLPPPPTTAMPPPSQKGKGKGKAASGKGKGLAARAEGQSEDHSFDEVVSEHSKNLEELRERQKVRGDGRLVSSEWEF